MPVGRNDPCPCGSGEKYKKCCLIKLAPSTNELFRQRLHRERNELIHIVLKHVTKVYGPAAVEEAWDEFHQWPDDNEGFDPDSHELQLFMPWFFFDWTPDEAGSDVWESAPRGICPAQSLLDSKSSSVSALQREYMQLCIFTGFSFHEILEVWPGRGFKTRDLLTDDFNEIIEKMGSENAKVGQIVFGKAVTIQDLTTLEACSPTMIPPIHKIEIMAFRKEMEQKDPPFSRDALWEYDPEIQSLYQDIYRSVTDRRMPTLVNTDGELMIPHKLSYDLLVPSDDVLKALADLNSQESYEEILEYAEVVDGELQRVEFPWSKIGNAKHAGWENTVLGHIKIKERSMTVEVNSENRAAQFEIILEKRLVGKYKLRAKVIESLENQMRDRSPRSIDADAEHEALQNHPDAQAQMKKMMAAHWGGWISSPIPALGDISPIKAIKTKQGRESVDALLNQFEMQIEERPQVGVTLETFQEIRNKLGLN